MIVLLGGPLTDRFRFSSFLAEKLPPVIEIAPQSFGNDPGVECAAYCRAAYWPDDMVAVYAFSGIRPRELTVRETI